MTYEPFRGNTGVVFFSFLPLSFLKVILARRSVYEDRCQIYYNASRQATKHIN